MHIFVLLAIGLSILGGGTADWSCIGPPAVAPLSMPCNPSDAKAYVEKEQGISDSCSTLYIDENWNIRLLMGWAMDGAGYEETDNPLLSDDHDCLCRMWKDYPDHVIWEGDNHYCWNMPNA
mgnify:CR=1 FL=1